VTASTRDAEELLGLTLRELLDALAGESTPASGTAAALVGAMAAELVAMTARACDGWPEGPGVAAQARALSARLLPLAHEDAAAFRRVLDLRARAKSDEAALGSALDRAAEVPLRIADATTTVAELAELAVGRAAGHERADAVAAAALAEGAARAAAALVHANLATRPGDQRSTQAEQLVRAAAAARERAHEPE
jgi:formiminotetrahydrofolate cyclodeaminase